MVGRQNRHVSERCAGAWNRHGLRDRDGGEEPFLPPFDESIKADKNKDGRLNATK